MNHQQIVDQYMRHWTKATPSPEAIRVAELLHRWQGLHHFEHGQMAKVNWTRHFVDLRVDLPSVGGLSTWDFYDLTSLVFLAHDLCIRVQIGPVNARFLSLMFHPRSQREGDIARRHPTLEQAVERWREQHPADAVVVISRDAAIAKVLNHPRNAQLSPEQVQALRDTLSRVTVAEIERLAADDAEPQPAGRGQS